MTEVKRKHQDNYFTQYQMEPLMLQRQLTGYQFLRNAWGTYFHQRDDMNHEDKLDNINKIVGIMKAQTRIMIIKETENTNHHYNTHLENQLTKTKQALQRSNMQREETITALAQQQQLIAQLYTQNQELKKQLTEMKKGKNNAEEKIIELSNQIYDLERLTNQQQNTIFKEHNTLDQYSAFSQTEERKDKVLLIQNFKLTKLLDQQDLCNSDQNNEHEELQEMSQNVLLNRHPLKSSLPVHPMKISLPVGHYGREIERAKKQTERMCQIENLKLQYRNTLPVMRGERPQKTVCETSRDRRFKRIR